MQVPVTNKLIIWESSIFRIFNRNATTTNIRPLMLISRTNFSFFYKAINVTGERLSVKFC